jgi:hypothetical protein
MIIASDLPGVTKAGLMRLSFMIVDTTSESSVVKPIKNG